VLIFGTFDVDNYGDLLFPLIAQWRINARIGAVSPTKVKSVFHLPDSICHLSFNDLATLRPKLILIGGGNILHFSQSQVFPYQRKRFSYAGLQFYPVLLKRRCGAKIIYNSPSIAIRRPRFLSRILFRHLFANSDYLSFRDSLSVSIAKSIVSNDICFVPDTAFDISRLFPLDATVRPCPEKYLIAHVNSRYGGNITDISTALDRISLATGYLVVLLPIGPCHGDAGYAEKISDAMKCDTIIIRIYNLRIFASYIANSEMYLGSSMHGFITALSYRVSSALILNKTPMPKFQGVLDWAKLDPKLTVYSDWLQAAINIDSIPTIDTDSLHAIFSELDSHWTKVRKIIWLKGSSGTYPPWLGNWKVLVFLDHLRTAPVGFVSSLVRTIKDFLCKSCLSQA
jgi:hypothetical protein